MAATYPSCAPDCRSESCSAAHVPCWPPWLSQAVFHISATWPYDWLTIFTPFFPPSEGFSSPLPHAFISLFLSLPLAHPHTPAPASFAGMRDPRHVLFLSPPPPPFRLNCQPPTTLLANTLPWLPVFWWTASFSVILPRGRLFDGCKKLFRQQLFFPPGRLLR